MQYISQISKGDHTRTYLLGTIDNRNLGFTFRMDLALTSNSLCSITGLHLFPLVVSSISRKLPVPKMKIISNDSPGLIRSRFRTDSILMKNKDSKTDFSISNPDFNFHQFRSKLVLRWEYKAGSAFYLVWAQDRTGYEQAGPFAFNDGFSRMFDIFPRNIFMFKFNYWFSL